MQVAAYADSHLCVRKATDAAGRILTTIAALDSHSESVQEIAAMLGEALVLAVLPDPTHSLAILLLQSQQYVMNLKQVSYLAACAYHLGHLGPRLF